MRPAAAALALLLAACGEAPADSAGGARADGVATAQSTVVVDYVGRLDDGTVFDQGEGVELPLAGVVPGFRAGIVGMQEGEEKTFAVPPEEGYGVDGIPGAIPPNATLTFDVTLHEVR